MIDSGLVEEAGIPPAGSSKPRRSSCLAVWQPVPIEEWPVPRILSGYYEKGLSPPVGISHEELYLNFMDVCEDEAEVPVPHKAPGKSKRASTAGAGMAKKPRAGSTESPLSSMVKYLCWRSSTITIEPLFFTDAGKAMSTYWFTGRLGILCRRCGLDPKLYTAHSFRIGAATSASQVVSASTLKVMGRWSSASVQRYIRLNATDVLEGQRRMASTLPTSQ